MTKINTYLVDLNNVSSKTEALHLGQAIPEVHSWPRTKKRQKDLRRTSTIQNVRVHVRKVRTLLDEAKKYV